MLNNLSLLVQNCGFTKLIISNLQKISLNIENLKAIILENFLLLINQLAIFNFNTNLHNILQKTLSNIPL